MVYRGPGGVNVVINPYFCGKLLEMVLRAALLQMDIEWGKPAANRAVAGRLVRALHDTDIAFLPEMFTTGFMAADTALAEPMEGPSVEWMRCTAAETGIALAGSLIIGDGRERPYNRFVFAFPDGRIDWYDKRHLFSFSGEDTLYAPGCVRVVLEYKGFRILPMVCYDLRFPVWSRARSDYDVAVYAASWPQAATRRPFMTAIPSQWISSAMSWAGWRRAKRALFVPNSTTSGSMPTENVSGHGRMPTVLR